MVEEPQGQGTKRPGEERGEGVARTMFEDGCLRARSRRAQSGTQERNRVRRRQPKNSGFRKCQPDETTQQLHLTGPIHVPWGEYREENEQNTGTPGPGRASRVFTRLQSWRMEGCFRGNDQSCGHIVTAHLATLRFKTKPSVSGCLLVDNA